MVEGEITFFLAGFFRAVRAYIVLLASYIVFVALSKTYIPTQGEAICILIFCGFLSAGYAAWHSVKYPGR